MDKIKKQNEKVVLDKSYLESIEKKAFFLDEFLSFIEDKYLGDLMEETEGEKNISLSEAEKILK